jgi:hypothetical protein
VVGNRSFLSTALQSCSVDENGTISGTIGFRLDGGSFNDAVWRGANGSGRSGSNLVNNRGLTAESGNTLIDTVGVTIMFMSMDSRYGGVIAEQSFFAETTDDVSKCF